MDPIVATFISLLFLVPGVVAQERTPIQANDPLVVSLLAHAQGTKSLKADFSQEKHLRMLSTPVISEGLIRFESPGKLRWQVDVPDAYVAVVNGKEVRITRAGKEVAAGPSEKQAFAAIGDLIEGIVSGTLMKSDRMTVAYFSTRNGLSVELTPTDARMLKRLKRVDLLFNTADHSLRELRMEQPDGEYTLTRFSSAEFAVKHPNTAFTLP